MKIIFIKDPIYKKDFTEFLPKQFSIHSPTESVLSVALRFFKILRDSTFEALSLTLRTVPSSFTHIVPDSFGSQHFYSLFFTLVYFVYCVGVTFIKTLFRLLENAYALPKEHSLSSFVSRGIDLGHLRAKELCLDTTHVPGNVQVKDLLTLFEQINFDSPNAPNYMPPSARAENGMQHPVENLRKNLEKFVHNVNHRVPFVGTPKESDLVSLHAFYNQIEAAVRLSIYKVTQDLKTFKEKNPIEGNDYQDASVRQEYNHLLENQARLVIDLAIAGNHCGGRYMGEALSSYSHLHRTGKAEGSETLEDALVELLAEKRKNLADREVAKYLGNHPDTHKYAQYFDHMGKLLALPGFGNVIERFLSSQFEVQRHLASFFDQYNEDFIIDVVQEKIKKSQSFREQVIDWLKEQVGSWTPKESLPCAESIERMREVLSSPVDTQGLDLEIELFKTLLFLAKDQAGVIFHQRESWADFVEEVFHLDCCKEYFNSKYETLSSIERIQKRMECIQKFRIGMIGRALEEHYLVHKDIVLEEEKLRARIVQETKMQQMRSILPVQDETLIRILEGKANLAEIVENTLKQSIQTEFLEALNVDSIATEGLSLPLMEWLLDSHHIFVPKVYQWTDDFQMHPMHIPPNFASSYCALIDPQDSVAQLKRGIYPLGNQIAWKRGALFETCSDVQALALHVFDQAFTRNREAIIRAAEAAFPKFMFNHLNWSEKAYLSFLKNAQAFFENEIFGAIFFVFFCIRSFRLASKLYYMGLNWADRVYRLCAQHYKKLPLVLLSPLQFLWRTRKWILENRLTIYIYFLMIRFLLLRSSSSLIKRILEKIDPLKLFDQYACTAWVWWDLFCHFVKLGQQIPKDLANVCKRRVIAFESKESDLKWNLKKEKCLSIWLQVIGSIP